MPLLDTTRLSFGVLGLCWACVSSSLAVGGPAGAQEARSWISIEPRAWINVVQLSDEAFLRKEPVVVAMGGISLGITPPATPNFSILATGLYGAGNGDAQIEIDGDIVDEADADIERADVEVLLRYTLSDANVSFFLGPRYVRFDEEYELGGLDFSTDSELWIVQAGLGGFADLSEGGNHRVFANLTTGISFRKSDFEGDTPSGARIKGSNKETEPMLDVNLGYQFIPTDWLSLSFRYRTFMLFIDNEGLRDTVLIHGPELGVGFRF